jgi:glycosyltransferase involved in cell wall biosynthesis
MTWISEPDSGIYDAMNKGIKLASGKLISFLNSSDWYNDDTLYKVLKSYTEKASSVVIYGIVNYYSIDGKIIYAYGAHHNILTDRMISHPATFISGAILKRLNGFNLKYNIAADYDLMLRILKTADIKFIYCGEILANFVEGGISSNVFRTTMENLKIKKNHGIITKRIYYYKLLKISMLMLAKKILP